MKSMKMIWGMIVTMLLIALFTGCNDKDMKFYFIGDSASEGCLTTSDSQGVFLDEVIIDIQGHSAHLAQVDARYCLKNEQSEKRKIQLQLPFYKIPEDLKISVRQKEISFDKEKYQCTLTGYRMIHSQESLRESKELVKQLGALDTKILKMKSASFSCEMEPQSDLDIHVSYSRELTFYDYTMLTNQYIPMGYASFPEKRVYDAETFVDTFWDEKEIEEKIMDVLKELYANTRGLQYYYSFLFEPALAWNHPISNVKLTYSMTPKAIRKSLTEDLFTHYVTDSKQFSKGSAASMFLFNGHGQRNACLLNVTENRDRKKVFCFEKENWTPNRNPTVAYLAYDSPKGNEFNELSDTAFIYEMRTLQDVSDEQLERIFEIGYGYFPVERKNSRQFKEKHATSFKAQNVLVLLDQKSAEFLRLKLKLCDKRRALFAWTLLAQIGYEEDVERLDAIYEEMNEAMKLDLVSWSRFISCTMGSLIEFTEFSAEYLKIRTIPLPFRRKIIEMFEQDPNEKIQILFFERYIDERYRDKYLPQLLSMLENGSEKERKTAYSGISGVTDGPPYVFLIEDGISPDLIAKKIDSFNLSEQMRIDLYRYYGEKMLGPLGKMAKSDSMNDRKTAVYILERMNTPEACELKLDLIEDASVPKQTRIQLLERIKYPIDDSQRMMNIWLQLVGESEPIALAASKKMSSYIYHFGPHQDRFIEVLQNHPSASVQKEAEKIKKYLSDCQKKGLDRWKNKKYIIVKKENLLPEDFVVKRNYSMFQNVPEDPFLPQNDKVWIQLFYDNSVGVKIKAVQNLSEMKSEEVRSFYREQLIKGSFLVRKEIYMKIIDSCELDKLDFLVPYIVQESNLRCLEVIKKELIEDLRTKDRPAFTLPASSLDALSQSNSVIKKDIIFYLKMYQRDEEMLQRVSELVLACKNMNKRAYVAYYRFLERYDPDSLNAISYDLLLTHFEVYSAQKNYKGMSLLLPDYAIAKELVKKVVLHHGQKGVELVCEIVKEAEYSKYYFLALMEADKRYYPYIKKTLANPVNHNCYPYFALIVYFEREAVIPYLEQYFDFPYSDHYARHAISTLLGFKDGDDADVFNKYMELYRKGELNNDK